MASGRVLVMASGRMLAPFDHIASGRVLVMYVVVIMLWLEIGLGRVVSVSSCGRVGSGLCRSGRYWVGSGWVGSCPCRVVVGLGRAFVGSGCGQSVWGRVRLGRPNPSRPQTY